MSYADLVQELSENRNKIYVVYLDSGIRLESFRAMLMKHMKRYGVGTYITKELGKGKIAVAIIDECENLKFM